MDNKLHESDRISIYEKVMLLCHEIQVKAFGLNQLTNNYRSMLWESRNLPEGNNQVPVMQEGLKNQVEEMEDLLKTLTTARENICDFLNGIDAVSQFDIDYSNIVYHYVNDLAIEPESNNEAPEFHEN